MPRIDPTRLLLCLKSLLNLQTGGIKTDKDVDKVFVLMTKFSKKLVSKCTYINILKATAPDVLNVFMDRGGWEMLHNWTVEAKNAKNHDLLNEILTLLLVTPASVDRLRANSLPKEIKQISNKWDAASTKTLAERLVTKWITIARSEDSGTQQQQVGIAQTASVNLNSNLAGGGFGMQNMVQLSTTDDAGLNSSNLADSSVFESEGQPNPIDMDVDYINNVDLTEMMDFNPDLFTKTIDQHLSELNSAETDRNHTMQSSSNSNSNTTTVNVNVSAASDVLQQALFIPQNTQTLNNRLPEHSTAVPTAVPTTMPVVSSSPTIPRIVIKTSGGQRSVVIQPQQGNPQVAMAQPVDNVNKERVCFVTHNGQRFLMQLQVADNETVDKLNVCALSMVTASGGGVATEPTAILQSHEPGLPPVAVPQLTQDQQVTSSVASVSPETSSPAAALPPPEQQKRKRPRKDPTITAMKNQNDATKANKVSPAGLVGAPKVLKTYSKKAAAVLVDTTQSPSPVTSTLSTPSPDTTKVIVTAGALKSKPATATAPGKSSPKSSSSNSASPSASSTSTSKRSSSASSKRSSSKSSAAAAAAAAEAEKAEKLKQKTKEAKRKMKERVRIDDKKSEKKKSEDDKQKQKDDQTLKEIYGASASQTAKIPKKPKPSFTDLIGVPGATEEPKKEKITKEKNDKSGKDGKDKDSDSNNSENKDDELTDVTGLGAFARPESKEIGPAKERRHQVKVYVSAKSKNMDLLETMTKGAKIKPKLDGDTKAENLKPEKSGNSGGLSFEDAISGASPASSRTTTKRPSIDSASKNTDAKKLKMDDSLPSLDTKKDSKSSKDRKGKDDKKSKEPSTAKKTQVIQESSLFMDTLNATREPAKTKRRRRISSSTDLKEKDTHSNSSTNNILNTHTGERESPENKAQPLPNPNQDIVKPVMNFYRDTLNDSDDDGANTTTTATGSGRNESDSVSSDVGAASTTATVDVKQEGSIDIVDDFAPEEWEGKLKSCLCIHRPKGKPKKLVRWREEEELKEFHFFEMDETERVNVTKQIKNFSEMKLMERSEEKLTNSNWKQKEFGVGNPPEERFAWFKPRPIEFSESQVKQEVNSNEKQIQEDRERSILEVFYFPGTMLPEHPSEVDVINMEIDANNIPTMIPADDVPVLTKMYDFRSKPWPRPMIGVGSISTTKNSNNLAMQSSSSVVQNIIPNQNLLPIIDPNHAFPNVFNPAAQQVGVGNVDAFNPWVQTFNQTTVQQVSDPWKVAQDVTGFPSFPSAGNVPPVNAFQPLQAFGFPFATAPPVGNIPISQLQQPHLLQTQPVQGQGNFGAFGITNAQQQFDPSQATAGREDSGPSRHQHQTQNQGSGQGGRGSRDVDYRDIRRNDNRERDRDDRDRNRDRDRPGRGDRGRDRDFRDRGRDRSDRYDNDRDYRSHDRDRGSYKRPAGGRRATPCNYFAKGFCREGSKCSFLHPGVNGPSLDNAGVSSNHTRRPPSSPPHPSGSYYENSRRRSPPSTNKELPVSFQGSPPSASNASSSMDSHSSHRSREIPEIQSPTPETEIFDAPPSSPSENHAYPIRTEPVKVIPTFTEEDWA